MSTSQFRLLLLGVIAFGFGFPVDAQADAGSGLQVAGAWSALTGIISLALGAALQ